MNKFKRLIKESGMTARQVAIKAGIPNQNIYEYMNGNICNPSLDTGFKLADCLGIDIN
ncbi:helix-turn-helix transcriptional regulator [Aerococcus sp. HMSC062A02]|uniref:helix-turn-helix domain-containing protein n=1 Tax=Aerococcus sp. HMSC062A02 TaxID=1715105 RepID=UPI0009F2A5B1|nr:helix-turn-helix transcriptional regulator [Aerococcus sp. HMSC062A02]